MATSILAPGRLTPRRSTPNAAQHRPRHPRCPPPVRTSEFWYDEEEEFDAIAGDSLRPKHLTVVVAGGGGGGGGASIASTTRFDACFHSPGPAATSAAADLWAGRPEAGPPFFIKPRARPDLDADPAAAWAELAGQNWRAAALLSGLDAATTAASEGSPEGLLVVVEGAAGAAGFLSAAGVAPAPGGVTTVRLAGWTGDGVAPLPLWRSLVVLE